MAHLSRGDVGALEALSERHARPAYSLALRVVGDHGWAEELLQDVLLRLWRKPQMYDPSRGDVRRWLLSVTHHAAIDALRGRRGTARNRDAGPTPLAFLAWEGEDPAESAYKAWRAESVRQALAELPGAQREALELAYFSGLSQTEIAAHTGEALGTIKTRIRLGMTKLRQSLRQVGANE
jgi:RNA polymerase sigma-70 factor (ECF subfamily)